MIWFFLGGMVAGAAGVVMYANWWMEKHTKKVWISKETPDDVINDLLRAIRTGDFGSCEDVVEYIDSIEKRMDEAIKNAQEKEKEDKTHE